MPVSVRPTTKVVCHHTARWGMAAVVGNEDGAQHVAAEVLQALLEVGFSAPPGGVLGWVGEAMGSVNYIDLKKTPKAVADWTPMLASNAAHSVCTNRSSMFWMSLEKKPM